MHGPDTSAGPGGVSVVPPAYGIDGVDCAAPDAKTSSDAPLQLKAAGSASSGDPGSSSPNRTGLPDALKSGVESLSGLSLDDVRVHYNSSKPAQLQALAYTQGSEIHIAPGQERHVPHEAWHVVQQKQGRVKPIFQMKTALLNDDAKLEKEADRMGEKATRCPQPMKLEGATLSGPNPINSPIQRKIGAEIEVPGVFLTYDQQKPASQGETVARIVPGIVTEIHLEGPKDGVATLELATGLHGQYPADHPLSLAFQVGYLATWIEIAKLKRRAYLKDMPLVALDHNWQTVNQNNGPLVEVDNSVANAGAFQINVSPTEETASTFQDVFDTMNAVTHNNGVLTEQAQAVNGALRNSKTYALNLYDNIIQLLGVEIGDTVPPILRSVIKALTSVPRVLYFKYLRAQEGFDSPTRDIIDKNILDLLPRANLQELWIKALQSPQVTSLGVSINEIFPDVLLRALSETDFPQLAQSWTFGDDLTDYEGTYALLRRANDLVNNPGQLSMDALEAELTNMDLQLRLNQIQGRVARGPSFIHGLDLSNEAFSAMLDVLNGAKILVRNRQVQGHQAPSILERTDSSLRPVNEEEGLAGVFEIRNPFTHMIPLADWKKAIAAYEVMLAQKHVKY